MMRLVALVGAPAVAVQIATYKGVKVELHGFHNRTGLAELEHVLSKTYQAPAANAGTEAQVLPSGVCSPQCHWNCAQPQCEANCEPVCAPPQCNTQCLALTTDKCSRTCKAPKCAVVCPQTKCASKDCLPCKTVCAPPDCKVECASDGCDSKCADPSCEWKCKAGECPAPVCSIKCDAPKDCGQNPGNADENDIPQVAGAEVYSSGLGTLNINDITGGGSSEAAPAPAPAEGEAAPAEAEAVPAPAAEEAASAPAPAL